jgi:uncharacterized protein
MKPENSHTTKSKQPNRLIREKSPYLLQHAYNPVDWYPWGEEAFEKARREDKLIFLSVGYSTCHWCHVMAHESFEDPEVARLMNDAFVSIKVDREERPDIDQVYMAACLAMTGSAGWPLSVVITADQKPLYAATYIPKTGRYGRMGMVDFIPRIKDVWRNHHHDALAAADQAVDFIRQSGSEGGENVPSKDVLDDAYNRLRMIYDEMHGGFGSAPKFPMPHQLMFLLRYSAWAGERKALEIVEMSLQAMRRGGIYDHIGFGFHRYSTDAAWLVPHFEKMLYDQALLSLAYTEAYQVTKRPIYAETAREIFDYVLRDMTAEGGGFYSAEDADSEGEEGKFYLWNLGEILQLLEPEASNLFATVYHIEKEGNFIDPLTGRKTGNNILHLKGPFSDENASPEISEDVRLYEARRKLYAAREKRVHPHKDDKIITDWNGLMIAALAKGAQVFGNAAYLKAARHAADFILKTMRNSDGSLLHRYRDGQAAIAGNLDDYAFLVWGLLECYEAAFDVSCLQAALDLQSFLDAHFRDETNGGYYFTPDNGEILIVRRREAHDGAIPSGNAVVMLNLIRLARITGDHKLEEQALSIALAFGKSIQENPEGHTQFMIALGFLDNPSYEVVISGKPDARDTLEMIRELHLRFLPNTVVVFRPSGGSAAEIDGIAPFIKNLKPMHGKATAYVCTNFACLSPTTDVNEMLSLLNVKSCK